MKRDTAILIVLVFCLPLNGCLTFFVASVISRQWVSSETKKIIAGKGYPIVVTDIMVTGPSKYTRGKGVDIVFRNISGQELKYVTFTVAAFNGVGDPAPCGIDGRAAADLRVTGPVKIDESQPPIRGWDNVWYNPTVKEAKITKIAVTFMDNTFASFDEEECIEMLKSTYE